MESPIQVVWCEQNDRTAPTRRAPEAIWTRIRLPSLPWLTSDAAPFDRGRDARAPRRRDVRRARRRRRHHRRRRRPRRRDPGPAHGPRRGRRLRQRHVVEELQARPRRAALPPAGRRPPRLRGAPRAPAAAPQRPAPRQAAAVHDPDPHQGRADPPAGRPGPRLGDVDVRPHRRRSASASCTSGSTADAAFAHLPTMPRERLAGGYLYYDATTDDARLVLTVARTAAAARRRRRQPLPRRRADQGRRRPGRRGDRRRRRPRSSTSRARVVVNAAGVWADEVRALEDGVDPDSIRPAKGVHLTVPWEKVRNDIAVVIPVRGRQAQPVRRAVGPRGRRHVRAHLRRHHRHRLRRPARRPAVHRRRHRLRAAGAQRRRSPRTSRPTTSPACGPGCARSSSRRTSGRTADLSRRHRVTIGPAGVVADHRRQADDVPGDGRGHRRRGARAARPQGPVPHEAAARCSAPTATSEPPDGTPAAHLAGRYGTLAGEVEALVAADPSLGEPLVAGLPYLRAEAVYAVRHEMATTLDDVLAAAHAGPPVRPAGHARRRPRRRRAARRRARLGRRRDRPPGRRLPRRSSPPRRPTPAPTAAPTPA